MRAVLDCRRLRVRGRRQGDRLPHGHRRPPEDQPGPQEVFGSTRPASTLVEVPRLAVPGAKVEIEQRGARPVRDRRHPQRVHHPGRAGVGRREGPLAGGRSRSRISSTQPASGRRTARALLRDHVPERTRRSSSVSARRRRRRRRQDQSARVRVGRPRDERVARDVPQPDASQGGRPAGPRPARRRRSPPGLCELALGTDTGCSIRLPSAACEVVGLKSQWGLVPTDGVFPLVPTLDTVGPMARSVEDVALMWSVLTGAPVPEPRLAGLTVGLLRQPPGSATARDRALRRRGGLGRGSRAARRPRRRGARPRSRARTRGRSSSTRRCSRTRRRTRAAPTSTAS